MDKKIQKYSLYYFLIASFALLLSLPSKASAQVNEYEVKAIFVEKFIRYLNWPDGVQFDEPGEKFVVTVLGDNPFNGYLEAAFKDTKIGNREISINYTSSLNQITNTNLLFVSKSKRDEIDRIIEYTKNKSVFLIGDTEGFAQKGVFINFINVKGNVRFELNNSAASDSGFKIDFRLRKIADKIIK